MWVLVVDHSRFNSRFVVEWKRILTGLRLDFLILFIAIVYWINYIYQLLHLQLQYFSQNKILESFSLEENKNFINLQNKITIISHQTKN